MDTIINKFVDETGEYYYSPESCILKVYSTSPDLASKTICNQMLKTELFPKKFGLKAIFYATTKTDTLTCLIVNKEITKFLDGGSRTEPDDQSKTFSEFIQEYEDPKEYAINMWVHCVTTGKFLFYHNGEVNENLNAFPISSRIDIERSPIHSAIQHATDIGYPIGSSDITELWTYNSNQLKCYNFLLLVQEESIPKKIPTGFHHIWLKANQFNKISMDKSSVELFENENILHQLIERADEQDKIDYNKLVDNLLD